jgi:hypothetical protein
MSSLNQSTIYYMSVSIVSLMSSFVKQFTVLYVNMIKYIQKIINDFRYMHPLEYRGVKLNTPYFHLWFALKFIYLAPKWRNWVNELLAENVMKLHSFTVTDVNFFGPASPERLGFLKGFAEVYEMDNVTPIPSNIVYIRGQSEACLVIVTIDSEVVTCSKKVVMVEQLRVPSGGRRIEAVAGMMDASTGAFKGPILTELEQEMGLVIKENDPNLQLLPGMSWPSPGGCDEKIREWVYTGTISEEKYLEMITKEYGEGSHEKIKLRFYDFDTFDNVLDEIGDYKASSMWRKWSKILRNS